jgi:hypothetical protein
MGCQPRLEQVTAVSDSCGGRYDSRDLLISQ